MGLPRKPQPKWEPGGVGEDPREGAKVLELQVQRCVGSATAGSGEQGAGRGGRGKAGCKALEPRLWIPKILLTEPSGAGEAAPGSTLSAVSAHFSSQTLEEA